MAPVFPAGYRPAPARPPAEPERRSWLTAAGWLVLVAVAAFFGLFFFRWSSEVDQRGTEAAEVAREQEHLLRVSAWAQDTSASAPVPDTAGRSVPTSIRAKRIWVLSRMWVDGTVWRREVMERHGLEDETLPAAWGTPRYYANARSYPEVDTYLEGRVAAVAEIEKTSAAWMEAHIAALAREAGMPAREIRDIFPPDFVRLAEGEARLSDALLELHRHLVRVDPRVHPAGGNRFRYEREDDLRRIQELEVEVNDALVSVERARQSKLAREAAALNRVIQ